MRKVLACAMVAVTAYAVPRFLNAQVPVDSLDALVSSILKDTTLAMPADAPNLRKGFVCGNASQYWTSNSASNMVVLYHDVCQKIEQVPDTTLRTDVLRFVDVRAGRRIAALVEVKGFIVGETATITSCSYWLNEGLVSTDVSSDAFTEKRSFDCELPPPDEIRATLGRTRK